MDYLYRAMKRDTGTVGAEAASVVIPEEQASELVAAVAKNEIPVPTPVNHGKAVPFPVKLERLYSLRTEAMDKEHIHALEQYRVLRSRVLEILRMQKMRTLMITSAVSGECKTTTSINLALALSQVQGLRVLLVDTDLRKSGIAEVLGIPYEIGLHDYLRCPVPLSDVLLQLTGSLFFVPSGGVDQNSVELLHSEGMVAFVQAVKGLFDIVIFDSPPLFPVADARVLANLVDAALFCVRAGITSETIVSEAIALIRPKLIGTVLAGSEVRSGGRYYYYSGSDEKR